jgi:hypothetical protein
MSSERANELMEAGVWLQLSGDSDGARRLFEHALQLEPTSPRAKRLLELAPPMRTRQELAWEMNPEFWAFLSLNIPPYENPFVYKEVAEAAAGITSEPDPAVSAESSDDEPGFPISEADEPMVEELPPPPPEARSADEPPGEPPKEVDEVQRLVEGANELIKLDDHFAALDLIHKAEALAPSDITVRSMRDDCERALLAIYESRIGPLEAVPRVAINPDDLISLNLDQHAGFVLAQIDGALTFEDLFALSGMSRFETARILTDLLEQKVIDKNL